MHITMPTGFLEDLDQHAKACYMSRSDYIRIALMEKMNRQNMVDYPQAGPTNNKDDDGFAASSN